MAVNKYFNHITALNERSLYNDLVVECIKNAGVDVYYIPREDFSVDPILRESFQTHFRTPYLIEMFFQDFMGPEGTGKIMSKFGLQVLEDYKLIVSRSRFDELGVPGRNRPGEGDLLYIGNGYNSFVNSYLEITFVENAKVYYSFGDFLSYEIHCQVFTFNYEKFETNTVIDNIAVENTNIGDLSMAINQGVKDKESLLISFNEKNPFGDF